MERHPTDPVSLVSGMLFVLIGVVFLLRDVPAVPDIQLRWLGPLLLLAVGLWVLVSAGLSFRRTPDENNAAQPPPDHGEPNRL